MGIDVVGSVLRIIFQNEEGGVVPIGAVSNGLDCPPHCQVVIRDRRPGSRHPGSGSRGMVVGQAKLHKLWHGIPALPAICNPLAKVGKKLFHAQLIGKAQIEVWVEWVKVTHQFGLGSHVLLDQRDWPGIGAGAATVILWNRFAVANRAMRTTLFRRRFGGSLCG